MNKQTLKEELIDLRMKLASAEKQALRIDNQLIHKAYEWPVIHTVYQAIQEADGKLCELANLLGLDKLDIVKPERSKYDRNRKAKRENG